MNSLDMDEQTEKIINGELEAGLLMGQASIFNRMSAYDQTAYMIKFTQRVKKITKPFKLLTVMLFMDCLVKTNNEFKMPELTYPELKMGSSKEQILLINIVRYFHYFLQVCSASRFNKLTSNPEEELAEAEQYCELSVRKILQFIKTDFIFAYAVN